MNLAIGRWNGHQNGHEPATWIDATEFAEVVYETSEVLVVSVAADLAEDALLAGALIDVIATCERCEAAEAAIATIAADLDLDLRAGHGRVRGERLLTIVPAPTAPKALEGQPT
jgi:hypothetical protein